jgi:hypothetical protein
MAVCTSCRDPSFCRAAWRDADMACRAKEPHMSKKNRKGNREARKPKQPKQANEAASSVAELGRGHQTGKRQAGK